MIWRLACALKQITTQLLSCFCSEIDKAFVLTPAMTTPMSCWTFTINRVEQQMTYRFLSANISITRVEIFFGASFDSWCWSITSIPIDLLWIDSNQLSNRSIPAGNLIVTSIFDSRLNSFVFVWNSHIFCMVFAKFSRFGCTNQPQTGTSDHT